MKSKKEIEQLAIKHANLKPYFDRAEEEYYNSGAINAYESFMHGYTQCQEDMQILISEWQLCPMCIGEGVVQNVGTSSSIHRTCPVCNGNKTLIKPII